MAAYDADDTAKSAESLPGGEYCPIIYIMM